MEFPHIGDTKFPILDNVNVYAYRNEFDYTLWGVNTRVKLTNVLWNSDYNDVVQWESDEARDKWFDENEDAYNITLTTSRQIPPEGGIKLPIPYDVAARYNYMVVDVQPMTSADNHIEYETDYGVRRWYFFVDTIESRAPNTTRFVLSLDVWTQYQHDIDIKYLFLERGHAPVAATSVAEYLANPIANNEYLLTPDVTPTRPTVTRSSRFIPFGNGEKWICLASTIGPSQFGSIGHVTHNDQDYTFGPLTYSDLSGRYGYQFKVDGFGIGNGDNYANLHLKTSPMERSSSSNRIQNNVSVYAFSATDTTFARDVIADYPHFMNSILGCFVVDREMIDIVSNYSIADHEIHLVRGAETTVSLDNLNADMFGYPSEYRRFAKLYTMPYASLQLTNNDGQTVDVAIENTGSITAHKIAQLAFPFVKSRVWFDGIGGIGSTSYQWTLLNGTRNNMNMPNSDWFDYCFDNDIPCYALYMDGETAWYLDNFNRSIRGGRNNALVQYHNAMRAANNQRENTLDSDAVLVSNTAADASTLVSNTSADASTLTANTANTGRNMRSNADLTIANNSDKASLANATALTMNIANDDKARALANAANLATIITSQTDRETTAATAMNSGLSSVIGDIGATAAGMALAGGAGGSVIPGAGTMAGAAGGLAAGALIGTVQAVANAISGGMNASIITQANVVTTNANTQANTTNLNATMANDDSLTTQANTERTYNVNHDNDLLSDHTDNNINCNNTNAGNTAATMNANAGRTANTMNANAGRTQTMQDNNATYTRRCVELNSKETLANARLPLMLDMYDARNATPRKIGEYAGDPTSDYMRTSGVQIKVRTMPDAEVRQVGDWFARYGYALEQVWDISESGLCPMRHFCYWKCRDAWVDDRKSSNNAVQQLFVTMLERGVTVWKNPEEVGRVSIYDN